MSYPAALGERPLEVDEAYAALEAYAAEFGRNPLLLLMHAAVPESLRADLLALIRLNFMPGHAEDLSLDADVLFAPLTSELGGGYFRIDPQVRWHCLALLRSLHRDEPRSRQRRVAELLWRYAEGMEQQATRAADPMLAEFLDIQRWVALAFLEPASAAHAFAQALHHGSEAPEGTAARLRLGGLASAIELPLAGENELLSYARGLDAMARGDHPGAEQFFGSIGDEELQVGGITLKSPAALLRQRRPAAPSSGEPGRQAAAAAPEVKRRTCLLLLPFGRKTDPRSGRQHDFDAVSSLLRSAATNAGLACIKPDAMNADFGSASLYRTMLDTDVVVCDLTLADPEMMLLLGIAIALRETGAILIGERGARVLFGDLPFVPYELGASNRRNDGEWQRIGQRLATVTSAPPMRSSPVYALLPRLQPPVWSGPATADTAAGNGCLVLVGSSTWFDPSARRSIDPDNLFQAIRDIADASGLACQQLRLGDEAGPFDSDTVEQLLTARLVVADVSASPPDVMAALGMRFALRPAGTIVLADGRAQLPYTFDAYSLVHYERGEDGLDKAQADRLRSKLSERVHGVLTQGGVDSPVYLALPQLRPPHQLPLAAEPDLPRAKAFVSYVHEYRDLVRRLVAAMPGVAVTSDMDLKPGDAWDESLRSMLEAADTVIAVAGRLTHGRPMPIAEVRRALSLGKQVIPVFVDPLTEPKELMSLQCANTDADGRIAYLGTLHDDALDTAIQQCAGNIISALRRPPQRTELAMREVTITKLADGILEFVFEQSGVRRFLVKYQPSLVNQLLEPLQADTQLPGDAARTLAQLLLPRELGDFPRPDHWRLTLDDDAAAWPWELLLSHRPGAPLAPAAVIRRPLKARSRLAQHARRRSALVISNPQTQGTLPDLPSGLPALPGAAAEAVAVAAVLRNAGYDVVVSSGEDARSILRWLFANEYQVVLVSGNAVRDLRLEGGASVSGFVLSDGAFLTALEIRQMSALPELLFLNGCHIGSVASTATSTPLADPMIPQLLQAGVRCVVAPAWAVDDHNAAMFSQRCFEALCRGATFELACSQARQAAFEAEPTKSTWASYQAWGEPDFRLPAAPAA